VTISLSSISIIGIGETLERHFQMAEEFNVPPLDWDVQDPILNSLCRAAWERLPSEVKCTALKKLRRVSEICEWTEDIKNQLKSSGSKWSPAKFNPTFGEICFSKKDCEGLSDDVIVGAFVHEVAHAFQTQITPNNLDAIEYAGDTLPCRWCFSAEVAAMILKRAELNPCIF